MGKKLLFQQQKRDLKSILEELTAKDLFARNHQIGNMTEGNNFTIESLSAKIDMWYYSSYAYPQHT